MNTEKWGLRVRVGLAALVVSAGALVFSIIEPASASSTFVAPMATVEPVPGTTVLNGIACHGKANCVAVGVDSGEGVVVPITDGVPGTPQL